jgi:hypothetical protein
MNEHHTGPLHGTVPTGILAERASQDFSRNAAKVALDQGIM